MNATESEGAPFTDRPRSYPRRPLCIDLDGTLIHSDLLIESLLALLKGNLFNALLLPLWLLKGKAYLKHQVADHVDLDVSRLPYDEELLEYIREQKALGREILLVTATNVKYAEQVAQHLGLFDAVLASDAEVNLSGAQKRDQLVEAFGDRGFDYAANGAADVQVWAHAGAAIVVNPSSKVLRQARELARVEWLLKRPSIRLPDYLRAMRLHQWLKNLLVFVPLATAHKFNDLDLLLQGSFAFLAFGLCASSVYLLNDLLDLPSDREHPTKRNRAFAAGIIPIQHGLVLIPVLLVAAFCVALSLPNLFFGVLGAYYALTIAYSLWLKRFVLVDVLALAALYTIRVIAGGATTGIILSFWLLAFSMFLFLSLALVKRYTELLIMRKQQENKAAGRGYTTMDLETLAQFGITSGYLSVVVLAFYVNSDAVKVLYNNPEVIWLICPLFLYWISYVWLTTRREKMHGDPVVFAIRDRRSHWLFAFAVLVVWGAL